MSKPGEPPPTTGAAPDGTLESAAAYRPSAPTSPPNSFSTLRGVLLERSPPTLIRVRYPIDDAWKNPNGVLQGGFLTAMMDNVVGMCAHAHDASRPSTTLELAVRFFRALRTGHVIVDGQILRAGRTTISIECVAWDDGSELCAKLSATNLYLTT